MLPDRRRHPRGPELHFPSQTRFRGLKNLDTVTGSSGSVAGKRRYDAYGNATLISGGWYGTFGHAGSFGYQEDSESGLQLLVHRYYDPILGRFITRDPIGRAGGRNEFTYVSNNPLVQSDSSGLRPLNSTDRAKRRTLYSSEAGLSRAEANQAVRDLKKFIDSLPEGEDDPAGLKALYWALDRLGDASYGKEAAPRGYKCNKFVYDAYIKGAGSKMPDRHPYFFKPGDDFFGANELGSPSQQFDEMQTISKAQLGDIVGFRSGRGSGHCSLFVEGKSHTYPGKERVKMGSMDKYQENQHPRVVRRRRR